ncbi:MAG: hypothetical protein ACOH5I_09930 [Oligoflexus sp.]
MRSAKILGSMLACTFAFTACGPNPLVEDVSTPRIEIDIPPDGLEPGEMKQLIVDLYSISAKNRKTQLTIHEFFNIIPVPSELDPYMDQIIASRDEMITIECQELSCVGSSSGTQAQIKLEDVNIPILGNPTVVIQPDIRVKYRFDETLSMLEVCAVNGLRVRSGFLAQNVDGALIVLDENDEPQTLKADVGLGGSYPSKDCDF